MQRIINNLTCNIYNITINQFREIKYFWNSLKFVFKIYISCVVDCFALQNECFCNRKTTENPNKWQIGASYNISEEMEKPMSGAEEELRDGDKDLSCRRFDIKWEWHQQVEESRCVKRSHLGLKTLLTVD